jgi:diguanylate cyclase (GGDEF)-like protein/PAS domain S-box-containing protein
MILMSPVNPLVSRTRVDCQESHARPSQTEDQARNTLDSIGDAVVSTDLDGRISYLNAEAERMTGWSRQEAHGRPLEEVLAIIDAVSRDSAPNPLAQVLQHDRPVALNANSVLVGRHGREFPIEDNATPIHDSRGRLAGAVMVFRDVSAARSLSLHLSHLAHHDVLTGLPNRLLLKERLSQAIASAHRHRRLLAVMYLDIDGFKHVNDFLGHATGDLLLQSFSRRLVASVRDSDTVSRQGGDEFVVLLAELAFVGDAARVAGTIVTASKLPHQIGSHCLTAGVSIGIGIYPADGATAEMLLQSADRALYRAKSGGRGTFRLCGN